MPATLEKLFLDDQDLMYFQENVAVAVNPLLASPLVGANLIKALAISTTGTSVAHKLKRKPLGWMIVSPNASAVVWQTADADATFLYLKSSAAVTAAILVF